MRPPKENLRLLEERDTPLRKQSMTMHQMEGSRTSSMAESSPSAWGAGFRGRQGTTSTLTGKKGPKMEKGALSLLGGTRKALKTDSSWSKEQGERARLSGLEKLMVVTPQERLAKTVMCGGRDTV